MQCETCRRALGPEQLKCPRRNLGKENLCPYRVEQTRLNSDGWGWMLFVGLVISLIPVTGLLIGEVLPLWIRLVLALLLLIGFYLMGSSFSLLFGRQLTIFNLTTGQAWQQTKFFGVPITWMETSAVEILPWTGASARILRYPASVAEWCRNRNAPGVFSTALLQLVAQGVVSIGQVGIRRRWRRPSRVYVLVPGEEYGKAAVQGKFEKRLADVVGQANSEGMEFEMDGNHYPRSYRSILCLEDAIRIFFGIHPRESEPFQFYHLVGGEAVELGVGEFIENPFPKILPGKNAMGKISLDLRSIDLLHHDFWTTQPEHARDVLAQIDLLVHSQVPREPEVVAKSASRL